MLVVPSAVIYQPTFTDIWTLAVGRLPDALRCRVDRSTALGEVARAFLSGARKTVPGEFARVAGLSRSDAGLGNRAFLAEGYAAMLAPGTYRLAALSPVSRHQPEASSHDKSPQEPLLLVGHNRPGHTK